jgi:hypothetical protein
MFKMMKKAIVAIFIGVHILRHDKLLLLILKGVIDEKNHRGRPLLQYISRIIEDQVSTSYQELKREANDRKIWKLQQTNH